MSEQKITYLKSRIEECLGKQNYLGAADFYVQMHDFLATTGSVQKSELEVIIDKIVKLLNSAAMVYIQDGIFKMR